MATQNPKVSIKAGIELAEKQATPQVDATQALPENYDVTEHALFPQTPSEQNAIMEAVQLVKSIEPLELIVTPEQELNLEALDATAAGFGMGGGDGGNTFVQLTRITESVDGNSYRFGFEPLNLFPVEEGTQTSSDSEVQSSSIPTETVPTYTPPKGKDGDETPPKDNDDDKETPPDTPDDKDESEDSEVKDNNGHGNNTDGQDDDNPGKGDGGPNEQPKDNEDEDEKVKEPEVGKPDSPKEEDQKTSEEDKTKEPTDDGDSKDGEKQPSEDDKDDEQNSDKTDEPETDSNEDNPVDNPLDLKDLIHENNGFGNGDQDAPGKSGPHNGAENDLTLNLNQPSIEDLLKQHGNPHYN